MIYVFWLVSLWFANYANYTVNLIMKVCVLVYVSVLLSIICVLQESAGKVTSHKFLPLIYQLAARMSNSHDHFQLTLQEVNITKVVQLKFNSVLNKHHLNLSKIYALSQVKVVFVYKPVQKCWEGNKAQILAPGNTVLAVSWLYTWFSFLL